MKKIAMIAALALMVGASGSALAAGHAGGGAKGSKSDASKAIFNAVSETQKAAKVKYEWRDTYKIIGKAKKAFKKGDYGKAIKLANKAKKQSVLAQAQQKAEANVGLPGYVKAASK